MGSTEEWEVSDYDWISMALENGSVHDSVYTAEGYLAFWMLRH